MLVYHDHDGGWQFHGAGESISCVLVCLQCVFERDPTIRSVADLPPGWLASRDHVESEWNRAPFVRDPE